ncbi:MAG TPA: SDR family NAD(P)-dependent oxidoreductase [Accumulibacter sp.]|uniref:SDR family NAD(P)-dependent oxidoreductase n=2 Tax=Accumulibacter sp. TaxID=2053492 RepID=UPI002C745DFB|nr:SDR family NAD(P)-dependent oxidoreductase [Accumulibacter sp.]HNL96265.1 SDR family NAD(P)-dependent oxidoreductase [Accumulibacter sp.]
MKQLRKNGRSAKTAEGRRPTRAAGAAQSSSAVAIVGMAFRLPGDLSDEASFWNALKEGRDLVTRVPAERWAVAELEHGKRSEPGRSISFSAGILSRIDEFDAGFFGISPREAAWLDPQQRLLLELTWEAMENAGVPPSSMAGSDCAVYVGISGLDYGAYGLNDLASTTAHSMTGNTLSLAANRLSYVFDLHGPSLVVDTACSSSLVALHHACTSLRTGEASSALVCGVSLLLHPYPFIGFTKASMLSADGRCKAFDAAGDGYVRAEGGAVVLLKPLDKALADGDEIHAVILASGVNTDGARKTGITIPSREGQAELMRAVLARSGRTADEVDFVEAHGTGTAVGDPIETAAIGAVYGQGRSQALPIGSVKANLGHLEPASGLAGLIKSVLVLKNQALPPALHLRTPNPHIDFARLNLELVTEYRTLRSANGRPLLGAVSSFGFGGANAHVLLQEFRRPPAADRLADDIATPPLFLSARSDAALRAMAGRYAPLLHASSAADYYDLAHGVAHRRERMEKRLALHADSPAAVAALLERYAQGETPPGVVVEDALPAGGGVAFIYSGNGAQWAGMGRALLAESPRFAEILTGMANAMDTATGFSLLAEVDAADPVRLEDTSVAQPLLFALQVGVTTLLRELGVHPLAVAGHSVGEIAAAWAAGALDLTQAIRVICARSQAQATTRGSGRMAAVGLSASVIDELMRELGGDLEVELAGINSPGNVTLAGSLPGLLRIQERVERRGAFFRLLDLDYAFHSRQMDSTATNLLARLAGIRPAATRAALFVSTVSGDVMDGSTLGAGYWWRNVREPVRFSEAIGKLAELGCRVFVEIGPHAILQRYIGESLSAAGIRGRVMPSLRRTDDGVDAIAETALRAHLLLAPTQLHTWFSRPAQRVRLPNYPWQRERHWHPTTNEGAPPSERRRVHPLLGWRLHDAEAAWENTLDPLVLPWLAEHQVGGAVVYPGAAYVEMGLAAARELIGGEHLIVDGLDIVSPLVFDGEHGRSLRLVVNPRDGGFQIRSRQRLSSDEWTLHAAGRLLASAGRLPALGIEPPSVVTRQVDRATHYHLAAQLGLDYGPLFQGLRAARVGAGELVAELEADLEPAAALSCDDYLLHPALLDLCFQSLVDFFAAEIEAGQAMALLPVKCGRIDLCRGGPAARLRARLRRQSARSFIADFALLDDQDRLLARASACRFRAVRLTQRARQALAIWRIVPWLRPHPVDGLVSAMPPVAELAGQARAALAEEKSQRQTWFKETLPLIEALTLSFVVQAFQELAGQQPAGWGEFPATPHGRWLADLLSREGLLRQDGEQWSVTTDADLPPADGLWQTLLRDSPACLPQLTLLGRVGRQLPALLAGAIDGRALLDELHHSPVAEVLYDDDPAYRGLRLAFDGMLRHLIDNWPSSRRLRILEIAAGASSLPRILLASLAADRFDYVLALPTEAAQARQQAEYQEHPSIVVTTFSADWQLPGDQRSPEAFDLVILRHTLHRTPSPHAALAQTRRWLAAGGIVLLAERHADWSANFLEGIDPGWWHEDAATSVPLSSLLAPEAWQQALLDEGFADCEQFLEPAAEGLSEGAYLLLARRPAGDLAALPVPAAADWLLLADEASARLASQLAARLESCAQRVSVASHLAPATLPKHLVCLLGWDDPPERAAATIAGLLTEVQVLAAQPGKPPRLSILTRGGALASGLPDASLPNPAQAAVWGFGRVVMNEYPQLGCTLLDLACDPGAPDLPARLENELLRPDGASEIILSGAARHCLVLHEESASPVAQAAPEKRFRLDFHTPGQLRNLVWLADRERPLRDDEIEVCTQAVGLNFRDLMYLMGLLPDEAVDNGFAGASLGLEFSGVVSRVGARVTDRLPGDAILGFAASSFSSHVVTRADAVALMPEEWSFEAAASVPTVFFTVYYALKHLGDLQPGERVLIHGAAGGVGIAALQLARHLGAEIYATAGSEEKRDFVRLLGADRVFDSRSLSFADDVLAATAGEGVDVVLNSLAGEAMRRSLDVLRPFGRFLELGKRDFFENTPLGLRPFRNNISYFGIDADQLLIGRPKLAARLFRELMALFREEALVPLPYRSFTAERVVDAFRSMQQARHIGKIVVSLGDAQPPVEQPARGAPAISFSRESTWIVSGGLAGFGLESARWLAERGVGNLVLVGRRGLKTPGAKEIVEAFAAQGVNVLAQACDISAANAVRTLVERVKTSMPPLKGILHAATTYDDRLLATLDAEGIASVLAAKLLGAWNLHQATLDVPLEHFIVYSSVTTAIGNPGQANYVAANAGVEGLTALRRHLGLPATCIAWGPIGDAGYLTRNATVRDSLEQRLGRPPISAAAALTQLDRALTDSTGFLTPANFDWNVLARLLPAAAGTRFELLERRRSEQPQAGESLDLRALIAGRTPAEIASIVRQLVVQEVAQVLCISPERIDANRPLNDLGMDSLMAVELALGLEQRCGIRLPTMMLSDSPTAEHVAARIVEKLSGEGATADETQPAEVVAGLAGQHGEGATAAEIAAISDDVRRLARTGTRLTA